jgi:hypothetical protein
MHERGRDFLTVVALAIVVFFLGVVIHEGVGHGLVCELVGGRVQGLSSVHCDCDYGDASLAARRAVQAGGTVANLVAGLAFAAALRAAAARPEPSPPTAARYFLWLAAVVNLLQAGGYLMVSPFGGFGDWTLFLTDLSAAGAWQFGLTAAGLALTLAAIFFAVRTLAGFVDPAPPRRARRAWLLTAVPYVTGGLVACVAALRNPLGGPLVVTSAAASTFGGTCCLLWVGYLTGVLGPRTTGSGARFALHPAILALAVIALGIWIVALAPGITR